VTNKSLSIALVAFASMASNLGCGGNVEVQGDQGGHPASVENACVVACSTDDACCPGFVCSESVCSPHLADDRCRLEAFAVTCDPRYDECGEGEACKSTTSPEIHCVAVNTLGQDGEHCDFEGEACGPGLWCLGQTCGRACCSDAECAEGERCGTAAGQLGSFGVCGT